MKNREKELRGRIKKLELALAELHAKISFRDLAKHFPQVRPARDDELLAIIAKVLRRDLKIIPAKPLSKKLRETYRAHHPRA